MCRNNEQAQAHVVRGGALSSANRTASSLSATPLSSDQAASRDRGLREVAEGAFIHVSAFVDE